MNLPRRNFLHLAASVAAFSAVSRIAWAQAYPMRPVQKRGSEDEAIGRSRGGLSTKINVGVHALGNLVRFILTPVRYATSSRPKT